MPSYEYICRRCDHEFEVTMSLQEYSPLRVCPKCNMPSPRKISAAQLRLIKESERKARDTNERARFEPMRVTRKHQCSDPNCKSEHEHQAKNKGAFQQVRAGSRPWMLG